MIGATVDGRNCLESVGATVEGRDEPLDVADDDDVDVDVDVGVDVVGEMALGGVSGAVGVGCVMTTGGGVTMFVFVAATFVARATFWLFKTFTLVTMLLICCILVTVTGALIAPAATTFMQLKQLMNTTFGLSKSSSSRMTTILT